MKYHYQFASDTSVRIELIAEDQKEAALLNALQPGETGDQQLGSFFAHGLSSYAPGSTIKKLNFMDFPKVALCNFQRAPTNRESSAIYPRPKKAEDQKYNCGLPKPMNKNGIEPKATKERKPLLGNEDKCPLLMHSRTIDRFYLKSKPVQCSSHHFRPILNIWKLLLPVGLASALL